MEGKNDDDDVMIVDPPEGAARTRPKEKETKRKAARRKVIAETGAIYKSADANYFVALNKTAREEYGKIIDDPVAEVLVSGLPVKYMDLDSLLQHYTGTRESKGRLTEKSTDDDRYEQMLLLQNLATMRAELKRRHEHTLNYVRTDLERMQRENARTRGVRHLPPEIEEMIVSHVNPSNNKKRKS